MISLSQTERVLLGRGTVLLEASATNILGQEICFYLLINENQMNALERDLQRQDVVDYQKYGEVILSCEGTPTEATKTEARALAKARFGDT